MSEYNVKASFNTDVGAAKMDAKQARAIRVVELADELRLAELIREEADKRADQLKGELFRAKQALTNCAYDTSFIVGDRVVIVTTAVAYGVIIQPVHQA